MEHARKIKNIILDDFIIVHAPIAELVKPQPFKLGILGSNPSGSTNCTHGVNGSVADF